MLIRQPERGAWCDSERRHRTRDATGKVDARDSSASSSRQMLPHATAAARELGVDPRAIIAQAALETGVGHCSARRTRRRRVTTCSASRPAQRWKRRQRVSRDHRSSLDGVATRTSGAVSRLRVGRGKRSRIMSSVLRDNPRYAAALNTGSDVRAFARCALQRGGYAHGSEYANKLVDGCRSAGAGGCRLPPM